MPGQFQAACGGRRQGLCLDELVDALLSEGNVACRLDRTGDAHHSTFVVLADHCPEDLVKSVIIEDGDGEDLAPKCQWIEPNAKEEDPQLAFSTGLAERAEGFLAIVVDQSTGIAIMLEVAEELLAVLTHHV